MNFPNKKKRTAVKSHTDAMCNGDLLKMNVKPIGFGENVVKTK